jgi:polysaccharide biosynthesis/export protein
LKILLLPALLLMLCALSSCRVFYPDLMFKTDPDFQFDQPDSTDRRDYVLRPGDEVSVAILSNNGYQLVDILGTSGAFTPVSYLIRSDGYASFPLIDTFYAVGYTVRALEQELARRYAYYFLNPYVRARALNRRIMIFTQRSIGRVITLSNDKTQLVEALAQAGALSGNKLYRVKVIRGDIKNPRVFLFDLSTIEGYRNADFLVDNQDIIYVEPSLTLADVNSRIAPILTVVSTILLIYTAVTGLSK